MSYICCPMATGAAVRAAATAAKTATRIIVLLEARDGVEGLWRKEERLRRVLVR